MSLFTSPANIGPAGSPPPASANATGVQDDSGNLQVLSTANPSPVATFSSIIAVTPTVTAATYAANRVVGGVQTLAGALRTPKNTGILNMIQLNFNTAAPTQGFVVSLFNANPSASTFTDNVAAAINTADVGKLLGQVTLSTASNTLGTHTSYTATSVGLDVSGTAGTLYAVIQCVGSSVFAATTTFTNAMFGFLQD